jgi:hypothetical protein
VGFSLEVECSLRIRKMGILFTWNLELFPRIQHWFSFVSKLSFHSTKAQQWRTELQFHSCWRWRVYHFRFRDTPSLYLVHGCIPASNYGQSVATKYRWRIHRRRITQTHVRLSFVFQAFTRSCCSSLQGLLGNTVEIHNVELHLTTPIYITLFFIAQLIISRIFNRCISCWR